jgi:AcrR family transcriptional regulator
MWRPESSHHGEHVTVGRTRQPERPSAGLAGMPDRRGGVPRGRPRGRPRDPRAHEAIVKATIDLLGEVGYAKLTIEAIAALAEVGKTTIYRRWRSKGLLVVEVLAGMIELGPLPDTGDTREDLLAFLADVVKVLDEPLVGQSIPGLANDLPTDGKLASEFRERIIGPRRERISIIMRRAAARGDVPADLDTELVTDMLLGPLLWRTMLTEQPRDRVALARIVDHVLSGLRQDATNEPPRTSRQG